MPFDCQIGVCSIERLPNLLENAEARHLLLSAEEVSARAMAEWCAEWRNFRKRRRRGDTHLTHGMNRCSVDQQTTNRMLISLALLSAIRIIGPGSRKGARHYTRYRISCTRWIKSEVSADYPEISIEALKKRIFFPGLRGSGEFASSASMNISPRASRAVENAKRPRIT